jgi:hypothetical protein
MDGWRVEVVLVQLNRLDALGGSWPFVDLDVRIGVGVNVDWLYSSRSA